MELKVKNELDKIREEEYLAFLSWISEQVEEMSDIMIIRKEEYDRFMNSDIEDDVMDMDIINDCSIVQEEFKRITGFDIFEDKDFVSMAYIDKSRNDINLTVSINGQDESFIVGV